MSPEDNKMLIRQGIEALNQRDMERYFAMYAPTCIFYEPPSEPFGVERDRQNAKHAFTDFPDMHLTIDDMVGEREKVVVRWTCRATHAPSGRSIAWTRVSFMRMLDGKVVEDWVHSDLLGLNQQLADWNAAQARAEQPPQPNQS
jgi:predicted ester cyclase